jgi:hypothetical protein
MVNRKSAAVRISRVPEARAVAAGQLTVQERQHDIFTEQIE